MPKDAETGSGTPHPPDSARLMRTASALVLICGVILGFDVGGEFLAALAYPELSSRVVWIHLGFEVMAMSGLRWAFILTRRELRRERAAVRRERERVQALRGAFDTLMMQRFGDWELSPAEIDIALLTVRGLKISEIAQMRGTREGTIKAQLSSIFRKAGVSTRTELLARFMDEFLDLGASTGA